jgi:hypothetical protein
MPMPRQPGGAPGPFWEIILCQCGWGRGHEGWAGWISRRWLSTRTWPSPVTAERAVRMPGARAASSRLSLSSSKTPATASCTARKELAVKPRKDTSPTTRLYVRIMKPRLETVVKHVLRCHNRHMAVSADP